MFVHRFALRGSAHLDVFPATRGTKLHHERSRQSRSVLSVTKLRIFLSGLLGIFQQNLKTDTSVCS